MERKQFLKDLGRLMLPIAFQNLMMTLVSATDALVLARVDQYQMAAVSLAAEISFVMNLFLGSIVGGISILASQYHGKGNRKMVGNLMSMGLRYNTVIALVFFLAARFAPEMLMRIYTVDAGLIQTGAEYLRIASWSYLFSAISQCYLCIMKIDGGAAFCAGIATATAVIDVAVDIYLVYGLELGAKGTAISTMAVCLAELLGVLCYSHQRGRIHPNKDNLLYFSREVEKDFRKLSLPVLMGGLVWGVGFSLSAAIMGHVNADASSAYAIAALIRSVFACFIRGLGSGAGIIVGRDLGCGDLELARRNGGRLAKASILCGILSGVIFWLLSPLVLQFFILNEQTGIYLKQMLPVCSAYMLALSVSTTVICGVFPAGGDTKFDAQITAVTMWLLALPLGYLAAFVLELPVVMVYIAVCLDEFAKVLFVYPRFKKYLWLQNLTREQVG